MSSSSSSSSPVIASALIMFLNLFLIPSILLLPTHAIAVEYSSAAIIKRACSENTNWTDEKLCMQVLQSEAAIVSATNMVDQSTATIKAGISIASRTQKYIEGLLARSTDPELKSALKSCDASYGGVRVSLESALSETGRTDYEMATYDLLLAGTDNIEVCQNAASSKKVKDAVILNGNDDVRIFALSAYSFVSYIMTKAV